MAIASGQQAGLRRRKMDKEKDTILIAKVEKISDSWCPWRRREELTARYKMLKTKKKIAKNLNTVFSSSLMLIVFVSIGLIIY
jgi:hypothetical protein